MEDTSKDCGVRTLYFVETRLAKMARDGDRRAFEELVNLYKDKIFHLSYRILGNVQEAEDIVQETFLRVFRNLHRYDENQKFSTWIYRIATNQCIDRIRKRKHNYSLDAEIMDGEGSDWYSMLPAYEETPESKLLVAETKQEIQKAIYALPAKYKTVIILRYLHDLSLQEISEVTEMPITTIKTRVHRGREYLRKYLNLDNFRAT